jgi:hypothetical protein
MIIDDVADDYGMIMMLIMTINTMMMLTMMIAMVY